MGIEHGVWEGLNQVAQFCRSKVLPSTVALLGTVFVISCDPVSAESAYTAQCLMVAVVEARLAPLSYTASQAQAYSLDVNYQDDQ